MGWFRGLSGNEVCGHYHQTECNAGTGIVCFEDAIALPSRAWLDFAHLKRRKRESPPFGGTG